MVGRARSQKNRTPIRWVGLLHSGDRSPRRGRRSAGYFFVAYAREDSEVVAPLLHSAQMEGYRFWVDHVSLVPGEHWAGDIIAAIRGSHGVIVFCSRESMASSDVYREVAAAARFDKPIMPVRLDEAPIPDSFLYYLSVHQLVDAADPDWRYRFNCALATLSRRKTARRPQPAPCADAGTSQRPFGAFLGAFALSACLLAGSSFLAVTGGLPSRAELRTVSEAARSFYEYARSEIAAYSASSRHPAAEDSASRDASAGNASRKSASSV
jgi:hypothetical protein